jgi:hypothetical protein
MPRLLRAGASLAQHRGLPSRDLCLHRSRDDADPFAAWLRCRLKRVSPDAELGSHGPCPRLTNPGWAGEPAFTGPLADEGLRFASRLAPPDWPRDEPTRGIPARRPGVANSGASGVSSPRPVKFGEPPSDEECSRDQTILDYVTRSQVPVRGPHCCAHEADAVCVVLLERALGRRRNHVPYLGYMHSHVQNAESRCAHTRRSLSYPAAGYKHSPPQPANVLIQPQAVRCTDARFLPEKREAPRSRSSLALPRRPVAADAGAWEGVEYSTDDGGQQQRSISGG